MLSSLRISSDLGPVVNISHGVFHSRLNPTFLKVLPSIHLSLLKLVWDLTTRCLTVTCSGRLSQSSWLLGKLQCSYTYSLT